MAELAREFDVSPITLRRDVEALAPTSASTLTSAPGAAVPEVEVEGAGITVTWAEGARTACSWTAEVPEVTTTG